MKETKKFLPFGRKVRRDHKSSVFAMVFSDKKEALRMILFEYDKKKYEKLLREQMREEGREEGKSTVFLNMLSEGIPKEQAQRIAELDDTTTEKLVRERNRYLNT